MKYNLTPDLDSRDDIIWLAGLAEGEACIDLHRGKYPRFRVAMTDRDVIGRVATLIGSRVRLSMKPAPYAATWHAEVQGEKATAVLLAILPHMGARRSGKIAAVLGQAELGSTQTPKRPTVKSLPGPAMVRPPALR